MNLPRLLLLPLLCAVPSCTISFGTENHSAERQENFAFDPQNALRLRVEDRNGSIEVRHGGPRIDAEVLFRATAADPETARDRVDRAEFTAHHEGDTLVLRVTHPDEERHVGARLTLQVPAGMRLDLDTSNAKIRVRDPYANVVASTSNGSIDVDCAGGPAQLASSNGSVTLRGTPTSFDVTTSNASIHLDLDGDFAGDGSARTSNGSISLELGGLLHSGLSTKTSNGKVSVDESLRAPSSFRGAGSSAHNVDLHTSNASISVRQRGS
ncbi:MAG TPA: hypothetical protein VGC54_09495 [Planctomycetota bacterium]